MPYFGPCTLKKFRVPLRCTLWTCNCRSVSNEGVAMRERPAACPPSIWTRFGIYVTVTAMTSSSNESLTLRQYKTGPIIDHWTWAYLTGIIEGILHYPEYATPIHNTTHWHETVLLLFCTLSATQWADTIQSGMTCSCPCPWQWSIVIIQLASHFSEILGLFKATPPQAVTCCLFMSCKQGLKKPWCHNTRQCCQLCHDVYMKVLWIVLQCPHEADDNSWL
jgi:hypothetical protein